MVPETWGSFVKLPHDVTWTMEQVGSELCVHGSTFVGWHLQTCPLILLPDNTTLNWSQLKPFYFECSSPFRTFWCFCHKYELVSDNIPTTCLEEVAPTCHNAASKIVPLLLIAAAILSSKEGKLLSIPRCPSQLIIILIKFSFKPFKPSNTPHIHRLVNRFALT